MKQIKIATKLKISLLALAVIPLLVTGVIVYNTVSNGFLTEIEGKLVSQVGSYRTMIEDGAETVRIVSETTNKQLYSSIDAYYNVITKSLSGEVISPAKLKELSLIGVGKTGYIFVIDYKGNVLVNKNKKLLPNEIFKTKRLTTFEKFMISSEKNKYIEYKIKDSNKNEYTKIAYLKKIDDLNFVIGLGFNLDIAIETIKNKTKELEDRYNNDLKKIFISAIIFTIILLIIKFICFLD